MNWNVNNHISPRIRGRGQWSKCWGLIDQWSIRILINDQLSFHTFILSGFSVNHFISELSRFILNTHSSLRCLKKSQNFNYPFILSSFPVFQSIISERSQHIMNTHSSLPSLIEYIFLRQKSRHTPIGVWFAIYSCRRYTHRRGVTNSISKTFSKKLIFY